MKWQNYRRSSNVEDQRSESPSSRNTEDRSGFGFPGFGFPSSRRSSGGYGFPFPVPRSANTGGRGCGCGVLLLFVLVFFLYSTFSDYFQESVPESRKAEPREQITWNNNGDDPLDYSRRARQKRGADSRSVQAERDVQAGGSFYSEDELADFCSAVLAMTEDAWGQAFEKEGMKYRNPGLRFYRGSTHSGCGFADSQIGPFYCPNDEKIYIDLSFYDEMQSKLGAQGGDFAFAYVLAHEVGHHVQKQLGVLDEIHERQRHVSKAEANQMSVRLELQADYFAGVFAHAASEQDLLDVGDMDEALDAAGAVGDDWIQKRSRGYVVPDSFTHGTSAQRKYWFTKGFRSGDLWGGDTFSATSLDSDS